MIKKLNRDEMRRAQERTQRLDIDKIAHEVRTKANKALRRNMRSSWLMISEKFKSETASHLLKRLRNPNL